MNTLGKRWHVALCLLILSICAFRSEVSAQLLCKIDPAIQGSSSARKHNFTDRVAPYNGWDSWVEVRANYWTEPKRIFSPYVNLTISWMSFVGRESSLSTRQEKRFDWQRYIQLGVGGQFYPARLKWMEDQKSPEWINGLRIYSWRGWRHYFRSPSVQTTVQTSYQNKEWKLGVDYYFDNFFKQKYLKDQSRGWAWSLWTDFSFRNTNFSHQNYNAMMTNGNFKTGYWLDSKKTDRSLFIYLVEDWSLAMGCPCRWWENQLRHGVGFAYFPLKRSKVKNPTCRNYGIRRIRFFFEWFYWASWNDEYVPPMVSRNDIVFGISFSTSGLLGGI
ncbi:MAG: hypothetical protein AAFW00_13455 [Bacteroidota bacterium]